MTASFSSTMTNPTHPHPVISITPPTSATSLHSFPYTRPARVLTPAQQPATQIPTFPPLLSDFRTRRHQQPPPESDDDEDDDNLALSLSRPKPCLTIQQAVILSQLYPEEWPLFHPVCGGRGITALSLRSLPSPEQLPISPPAEYVPTVDLDAASSSSLPSIKDILGEEWMDRHPVSPAVVSPCSSSGGSFAPPVPSINDDANDLKLAPIMHYDTVFSPSLPHIRQVAPSGFGFDGKCGFHAIAAPYPPFLATPSAQQTYSNPRLLAPSLSMLYSPPSLLLKPNNFKVPGLKQSYGPTAANTRTARHHPYKLSPLLSRPHPPSSSPPFAFDCAAPSEETSVNSPLSLGNTSPGLSSYVSQARGGLVSRGNDVAAASVASIVPLRPPYTFTVLITYAIVGSPQKKLALSQMYEAFEERFGYFRHPVSGNWKASVRHSLTSNKLFVKEKRGDDDPGQGAYWRLATLEDGVDATKMLLRRHGGRNTLPGRCVPTGEKEVVRHRLLVQQQQQRQQQQQYLRPQTQRLQRKT